MTETLLAQKGRAVPTGLRGTDRYVLAFADRRTVAFGKSENAPVASRAKSKSEMAPAATILAPLQASLARTSRLRTSEQKRRFTFRIDDNEHQRFCDAAAALGCSRQKLLERVLGHYLRDYKRNDSAPSSSQVPLQITESNPLRLV